MNSPTLALDHRGNPRDRSSGGRDSLYTAPVVVLILTALLDGSSRSAAARRAGISPSTLYAWLHLGRQGHPAFNPLVEALEAIEGHRALNLAVGRLVTSRGFWKRTR